MAKGYTTTSSSYLNDIQKNLQTLLYGEGGPARFDTLDYSKQPYFGAQHDFRVGDQDIGSMMNFAPFESGYCFLTVMATPKFLWNQYSKDRGDDGSNLKPSSETPVTRPGGRDQALLANFVKVLEKEFTGLSGIEDMSLSTTDLSNNIMNVPIVIKNERNIYSQVSMTFTEKSGLPLTKFLEMYTTYLHDPYTQVKTYGGAMNQYNNDRTNILKARVHNETFTLLYVITDRTALLVEKAFILYHAYPMNVPYSTIGDNTKFDIANKEITINWTCEVLDGPLANRLGSVYVRNLYDKVLRNTETVGEVSETLKERDWHFCVDSDGDQDTFGFYDTWGGSGTVDFSQSYSYKDLPSVKNVLDWNKNKEEYDKNQ
jgi:hypothetical protein